MRQPLHPTIHRITRSATAALPGLHGRVFKTVLSLSLFSMAVSSARLCFADNPIVQTKFTADPAPMVYDDTVYLYTSHDEDDATGFTMYNYLLYTSTDMVNWTDRGIIAGVKDPNKTWKWADGNNAWAPQVIFKNNKFYMYAPFPKGGHMMIGVAVADKPTGPFTDAIGGPLINNPNSSNDIDPTVFIDDTGQAYLYWGHQPPVFYVKLNEDMISYSGSIVQLTKPETCEEGPWFYQRNKHYYLAFASTCCPEGIGYAMSDSATGPWTYKGSIMDGDQRSSGNHPGIIDYKGTSYVFGFDYVISYPTSVTQPLPSGHTERRSVCVQKLTYAEDGTIPKLPFWTSSSVAQVGNLNPYVQTEAETIAWSKGLKTETCSEGGMDVTNIDNGELIKVGGVDFGGGATSLDVRVASAGSGGNIEVRLDSQTGKLVGTCAVSGTGGAQTWATKSCDISGASGVHDLFFVFTGGSGNLFNFNWWKFYGSGPSVDAGSAAGGATGSDAGITVGDSGAGGRGGGGAGGGMGGSGAGGKGGSQTGSGGTVPVGTGGTAGGGRSGTTSGGRSDGGGSGGAGNGGAAGGSPAAGSGGGGGGALPGSGGSASGSGGGSGKGGGSGAAASAASGCSCQLGRSASKTHGLGVLLFCLAFVALSHAVSCRRRPRTREWF
jgi:arabinoxylan arabinofuranohydrolase